jgi:hypothetical protein
MGFSNFDRSVELRTLDLEPSDAFVFVLSYAVSAQAGGAILAVEFLAVENFVSAFTAFDGSVDELKHKPGAQPECGEETVDLKIGRSHLRLSMLILLCAMKNLPSCAPS